jgi:hypothetical protein
MPQMMIDVSVNNIAQIIKSMSSQEIETLYLLLTDEGKELLKRKNDLDSKRVKFITREDVFIVADRDNGLGKKNLTNWKYY